MVVVAAYPTTQPSPLADLILIHYQHNRTLDLSPVAPPKCYPFWRGVIKCSPYFKLGLHLQWKGKPSQILDRPLGWLPTAKYNISISIPDCIKSISDRLFLDTQQYLDPLLQPPHHPPCLQALLSLIQLFPPPFPSQSSLDHARWTLATNGQFSVAFLYHHINPTFPKNIPIFIVWSAPTSLKVKFIALLALHDHLPTSKILTRHKITSSFCCLLCQASLENSNHLFLLCPLTSQIWEHFLSIQLPLPPPILTCSMASMAVWRVSSNIFTAWGATSWLYFGATDLWK